MTLSSLELKDFRNYGQKEFELAAGITVLVGDNATGKTNILEALYLLATGDSFRANRIDEMIRFGCELGRVRTIIDDKDLEVMVTTGNVGGRVVPKRRFLVDGAGRRKSDFIGAFAAVMFRPEDLILMDGSPSDRRKYLDRAIAQTDRDYARSLAVFEQALRRRNKLLLALRDNLAQRSALTFWDNLLIKHGQELQEKRLTFIAFVNNLWGRSDLFSHLEVRYDKSLLNEQRLEQYTQEELAAGHTLVGPHKDDFSVATNSTHPARDLAVFGSRGEQRMAVLGLKLGELYFLEDHRPDRVILLLDDIFSELDPDHRQEVLRVMQNRQVVLTSALEKDIEAVPEARVIHLSHND